MGDSQVSGLLSLLSFHPSIKLGFLSSLAQHTHTYVIMSIKVTSNLLFSIHLACSHKDLDLSALASHLGAEPYGPVTGEQELYGGAEI